MSLESGNWIKDLQPLNPPGTDPVSEGNDHIKLLKKVLKDSFPSDVNGPTIPDFSGKDGLFLKVKDDGSGFEWTDPTPTASVFQQSFIRPVFSMTDNTKLNISVGEWWIPTKNTYIKSAGSNEVTFPVGTSSDYTWYYVYIDETKITGDEVPSDGMYAIDTAPDTASYNGHYLGNDRCIFACVKQKDSTSMVNIYHDGKDYVMLGETLATYALDPMPPYYDRVVGDGQYHDVDIQLPEFTDKGYLQFYADAVTYEGASSEWYYRPKGESSAGHFVSRNDGVNSEFDFNSMACIVGEGRLIQIMGSESTTTMQTMLSGYFLPRGL